MKEPPRDQQPVMNSRPAMKCEPLRRSAWLHAFPILAKGPGWQARYPECRYPDLLMPSPVMQQP
jgi:hypothetical protein